MVLKRLLVTALSALGLGALAAGTASGQGAGEGNIPAPDIFDDQITCSMNVPTAMQGPMPTKIAEGDKTSPLDDAIKALRDQDDPMANPLVDTDDLGLGYVIPPMGANCGLGAPPANPTPAQLGMQASFVDGYDENGDGMYDGENDVAPTGSVPADVAAGYSALLGEFVAVYGDPGVLASTGTAGALADAQKALSDQIEGGLSGAALTPYQNAVTRAQEAHNKAKARFDNIAGGPINQAGVAEWMAKAAVTQAVDGINKQAVKADAAKDTLDGLTFGNYVPLGNGELVGESGTVVVTYDPATGMATVNLDQLIQYTNGNLAEPQVGTHGMAGTGDGTGSAGNAAPMGSVTTASNFDAAGNLIVPMEPNTDNDAGDNPNPIDIRAVVAADADSMVGEDIRARVEAVNAAAAALKKARDENTGLNQEVYDEAYRRAQLEADYYNEMWAKVLSDTEDFRTDAQKLTFVDDNGNGVRDEGEADNDGYEASPITIARRNAEYTSESNKLFTAEQTLRQAVATREAATAAVRTAFTSPHSFYEQLVSRRQALKAAADRAVASASEDGATPAESLTDAATAAAKALTDAEEAQASFAELFEDADDPTVALINELVKTGGDDGQALVDAISATYDTAAGAADAAREVVNELTGEGGAVSMNTANIENNSNDIVALEEEVWDADGNSRIDANETRSMENRTMIMTNADNIATNATNIAANTGHIMENRGMIETNMADIETNAGHIMENRGMIEMNASGISQNSADIASAMNSIGSNQSAISDNRNMIGELSDDLDVVRAGVAASMALAGMPAINGRGISIGVGSFDGESAFAVGFQIQGEMASFKVGVTSASGATGASAGVGFQF